MYEVGIASGGMKFITNSIKIGQLIQNLAGGHTDTHIAL
jgi:hypothetical protein